MLTIILLAAMEKALLMMLVFFIIMGAMGLYEAWRNKRGVLGWIVSFLTSIGGGALAMVLGVSISDALIMQPATVSIGSVIGVLTPVLMLAGSWLALRIVRRFR